LALEPDGRIIVSGRSAEDYFNTGDFAMASLNANGSIDSSFGTNGKVITDIAQNDRPVTCLIQPDHKIVMGGNALQSFDITMVLARFQNSCFAPVADFTFSLSGMDLLLEGSGTNITSWHWDFGDGTTDSSQNAFHTYAQPGIYEVCLVASNDCSSDTMCETITIIATSSEPFSIDDFQFSIVPNPLVESASIQFSLSENANIEIELFDLQGRKIKTIAEKNFEKGHHQLNFSAGGLSKGMFFLRMQTEKGISTQTIVIE
jgi:PKD repeat protein